MTTWVNRKHQAHDLKILFTEVCDHFLVSLTALREIVFAIAIHYKMKLGRTGNILHYSTL